MKAISEHLAQLRQDYQKRVLQEHEIGDNPVSFFERWYQEATEAALEEPNAMTLATVDPNGQPSARIVLLKGLEKGGFVFFTNYESRKGQDLAANNKAALLFFWQGLERQIRIEGVISKISAHDSDQYFQSRPIASRVGAIASPQSSPIQSREWLEREVTRVNAETAGKNISRPEHWGGYTLQPYHIEFWQGRSSRLHDRILFTLNKESLSWDVSRLAP